MLTQQHLGYFNKTLAKIKHSININIPIIPYDHDTLKGHKNALGICYADENKKAYQITIDEYFIEECYEIEVNGRKWNITGETLIGVICHEIAHTRIWRHGKKHTEFTNYLIDLVKAGKPHGIANNLSA